MKIATDNEKYTVSKKHGEHNSMKQTRKAKTAGRNSQTKLDLCSTLLNDIL